MRYDYKQEPVGDGDAVEVLPIIPLQLGRGKHVTPTFEAIVDSGSTNCIFNEQIAYALGIADITKGEHSASGSVVEGVNLDTYGYEVRLIIGADSYRIMAYFSRQLPVPGLLGRNGFFDKFIVTFDPVGLALEIERFHGLN